MGRRIRPVPLIAAMLLVAGCGGGPPTAQRQETPCAEDTPVGAAPLPSGLTLPPDQKLLRVAKQGKTSVVFASTDGGPDDLVAIRDRVLGQLAASGSTVVGTDQEPGAEAEAEVGGTFDGTLRVTPLCAGRVEVRYKVEG